MKDSKKITKIYEIILIAVFVLFLGGMGIYSLVDENPTVSEKEQRPLKQFPDFSISSYFDGSFMQDTQDAYADTFPMREFFVSASSTLKQLMTVTINDEIFIGTSDDGTQSDNEESPWDDDDVVVVNPNEGYEWDTSGTRLPGATPRPAATLPPSETNPADPAPAPTVAPGGSEEVKGGVIIQGDRGMDVFNGTQETADAYIDFVNNLSSKFKDKNVISLTAPTSISMYGPSKYISGLQDQKAWIDYISTRLDTAVSIDIFDTLKAHKNEYIYFNTDHHWTVTGAHLAYEALTGRLGMTPVDVSRLKSQSIDGFLGTMYTTTNSNVLKNNPDEVKYYIPAVASTCIAHYDREDLSKTKEIALVARPDGNNKYEVFVSGDNPLTVIKSSAGTGRSAVIIKNSYANALIPFLAHNYDNLYIIDPRHVNTTIENGLNLEKYLSNKDVDDIIICMHMNHVMTPSVIKCLNRLI